MWNDARIPDENPCHFRCCTKFTFVGSEKFRDSDPDVFRDDKAQKAIPSWEYKLAENWRFKIAEWEWSES